MEKTAVRNPDAEGSCQSELYLKKTELRKEIFAMRSQLSAAEAERLSGRIADRLRGLPEYQAAERIFFYIDFGKEVQTRGLIRRALLEGKSVAVPRIEGKQMRFYPFTDFSSLKKSAFGIDEPAGGEPVWWEDAFVVMPGVAFDKKGHRLGYGGGFYDRYLEAFPVRFKAALAFSFQVRDEIPSDRYDIGPDLVVTENELFDFS